MTTCKYCGKPLPSEWKSKYDHHPNCRAACQEFWQSCLVAMLGPERCLPTVDQIAKACDALTEEWRKRWL